MSKISLFSAEKLFDYTIYDRNQMGFRASLYHLNETEEHENFLRQPLERYFYLEEPDLVISVFAESTIPTPISWKADVQKLLDSIQPLAEVPFEKKELPDFRYNSNSCVIIISIANYNHSAIPEVFNYAICVGNGYSALNQSFITSNFGLQVALNVLRPKKIAEITSMIMKSVPVTSKKQSLYATDIIHFGMDPFLEIVRGIGGFQDNLTLRDSFVSGSDSLSVIFEGSIDKLKKQIETISLAYESKLYRLHFPWVDHFREVKSEQMTKDLENDLKSRFINGTSIDSFVSFKRPIDFERYIDSIRIVSSHYSLNIEIENFPQCLQDIEPNSGIDPKVFFDHFEFVVGDSWGAKPLRRSFRPNITSLIEKNGLKYYTLDSKWFLISEDFVSEINRRYDDLIKLSEVKDEKYFGFVPHIIGEKEEEYNKRYFSSLKKDSLQAAVFDRNSVPFHNSPKRSKTPRKKTAIKSSDNNSTIEVCDILTGSMDFVHIKRSNKSSSLSHLFKQGENSAHLLKHDKRYLDRINSKYNEIKDDCKTPIAWLHAPKSAIPATKEAGVVFGIIVDKEIESFLDYDIPIFSKMTAIKTIEQIQSFGFRWRIYFIGSVSPQAVLTRYNDIKDDLNATEAEVQKYAKRKKA